MDSALALLTIEIGIDPVIREFGGLVLTWHGIFTAVGIAAGVFVAVIVGRRLGFLEDDVYTSSMPPLFRGMVEVTPGIAVVTDAKGVRAFHTYSNTSNGLKESGRRHTVPLINSTEQSTHRFVTSGTAVSKQYHYSLIAGVEPASTLWSLKALGPHVTRERVFEEDVSHFPGDRPIILTLGGIRPGHYALVLHREGASWWDWFQRGQVGTVIGIFTGFGRVRTDPEGLVKMGKRWLEDGWRDLSEPLPGEYFPPQVEARIPHFWSLLPATWDPSAVEFSLERKGPVHLVIVPHERGRVTGIQIDRVSFGSEFDR